MHDLDDIRDKTLHLMDALGTRHAGRSLRALGWTFAFDRARKRLGACRWRGREKRITLSAFYARQQGWAVLEDVARHEIAHALDVEARGRTDHGAAWKRWARRCGADPTRLYEGPDLADAQAPYVGTCPACGKQYRYYRRLKHPRACADCCRAYNGGRYAEQFELILVEQATGRRVVPAAAAKRGRQSKYTATCPHCGRQVGYARRLKRRHACRACCDRYSDGRFDPRFELVVRQNY